VIDVCEQDGSLYNQADVVVEPQIQDSEPHISGSEPQNIGYVTTLA